MAGAQRQRRRAAQWLEVGGQQGATVGISVIDPQFHRLLSDLTSLQPPAQASDAATGHQIEPAQRPLRLGHLQGGQKHRKIP